MSENPVNILLVDDQPAKLLAYEAILGEMGEHLIKAHSAREALDVLLKTDIAAVLIDVCMPELDGFELAEIIREHPRYEQTAIIFVSGVHMSDLDRVRGYRSGAVDYVSVPIVPEILRAKVGVFVELYRKTRQLETLNRELEKRVAERTSELEASAVELRSSEERLRLALESAGAASWDWDAVADRLDWTPRFCRLYGFEPDEKPSLHTVLNRAHVDDRERLSQRVATMLANPGDDVWNEVFRIVHPERGVRNVSGLGRVISRDESGRVIRMTGIDLDVTERVNAEQALKEADRRKDQFLATLSHELRNPLAPILNAVQLLRYPSLSDAQRQSTHAVIQRQVEHMVRLVDDLLDVSRITSDKIALQRGPVELTTVVTRAVEICQPLFDSRRLVLDIAAPIEPVEVYGDLTRLVQVLANVLNNAGKYTDAGGRVTITISQQDGEAVLSVRDTGIGIPPDLLPRVFDLFTQASVGGDRTSGGLGVGLAIVQRLVQMHGGSVTGRSAGLGHGSEFEIRLPLHRTPARLPQVVPPPAVTSNARRIVIADDNQDAVEMLALLLQGEGHEVQIAHDGIEAVELVEAFRPNVVILDIGMPRLDGYGAARRIRAEPWGQHVLLIAQTGWGQPEDRRRAADAGFDAHLTKPVDIDRLVRVLQAPRGTTGFAPIRSADGG